MLDPKCNNGFITFRINGLLHLGPNFITFRTFITFKTNLVLHLGLLLHLGHNPYYISVFYYIYDQIFSTFRTFISFRGIYYI